MQSRIRILNEHTINQIAAGEVIENPASVVKEIVENSIDAEATEITVEIVGGGRSLIRITDNGYGMNRDDAVLCLERHATSKIKHVDDIQTIMTMGFRGEAIPSIASISKFSILTKAKDEEIGTLVVVDGGKILQCVSAARAMGTTMEIKSLFFNVPVRRKFQKSPTIDTNEILKTLSIIALGNPHIKFELISNEKKLLTSNSTFKETPLENLKNRIKSILGADFAELTCPVDGMADGYSLSGFIGFPSTTRQNRTGQYLFINKRAVQNSLISFAVRDAYGTTLPTNRHPIYVLHLTLDGELVDVNVHPQKREVRLRQETSIKELIIKSVEKALQNSGFSLKDEGLETSFSFAKYSSVPPQFSMTNRLQNAINESKDEDIHHVTNKLKSFEPKPFEGEVWEPKIQVPVDNQPHFFSTEGFYKQLNILTTIPGFILIDPNSLKTGFELEQKGNTLICLVDQKLAQTRIIFEKLLENKTVTIEPLLIPYTFELTLHESSLMLEHMNFLNNMGLQIHQSGSKTFLIDGIPQFFGNSDVEALLKDLIAELKEFQNINSIEKEKEKRLAFCATRTALSDNKRFTLDEAKYLLQQLMKCQMPYQCPKGKPIFASITKDELKYFFT
jgi:DNA mismatch repair protein MutL